MYIGMEVHIPAGLVLVGDSGQGEVGSQALHVRNGADGVAADGFSERQRRTLAQLAGDIKLTRRQVEGHFGISDRTAKRELNGLVGAGMIEYDRMSHPGFYRLR